MSPNVSKYTKSHFRFSKCQYTSEGQKRLTTQSEANSFFVPSDKIMLNGMKNSRKVVSC